MPDMPIESFYNQDDMENNGRIRLNNFHDGIANDDRHYKINRQDNYSDGFNQQEEDEDPEPSDDDDAENKEKLSKQV